MSSGSSNSTLLNMPDYGDGLAEALTAQTRALSGELTGAPLQQTMERYERPLRMSAAQIDNDVLRQTLLGGQVPVYESAKGKDIVQRRVFQPGEGGQTTQIDYGGQIVQSGPDAGKVIIADAEPPKWVQKFREINALSKSTSTLAEASDAMVSVMKDEELLESIPDEVLEGLNGRYPNVTTNSRQKYDNSDFYAKNGPKYYGLYQLILRGVTDINRFKRTDAFQTTLDDFGQVEPIYKKNDDGTDFIVPKDEDGNFILEATNETEIPQGGVAATPGELTGYTRAGTGLVDMMGDTRNVMDYSERPDYAEYVNNNADLQQAYAQARASGDSRTIDQWGEDHYLSSGRNEGRDLPTTFDPSDTGRQAGFDADGNFLGLAALAEDIQRGNLSRQREADLADVERLSSRYQDVMADYKPETAAALSDAGDILQEQKNTLTGGGAITVPTDSTYGGDIEAGTMTAAQVADPLKLSANTQFSGDLGLGQTATGEDSLRSVLLGDARTALGQGLTEREQANIANAARARSTMMGRTFDQSGAIAEAEARVAEDNNRRMQNRSFAQSVLGQEAGYQQGDITRAMAQESEQAGLQQRADLAQAQFDQQANAFDADAAMRASQVNQAQRQQANQFGTGATMDAQRLNEQLKQSGTLGYVDAATRLAALEDQQTLDPFQALLGRAGGGSLQAGQGVFGQAGYGLSSGPNYLNPESGLGYISSMAANNANMYAANQSANAARDAGMMNMFGSIFGSIGGGLAGRG